MKSKNRNKMTSARRAQCVMTKSCIAIEAQRLKIGASIEDLAIKSGVSEDVIRRIESECWIEFFDDFGRILIALGIVEEIDSILADMLPQ